MHIKYFITVLALSSVGLCLPAGDVTAKEKLPLDDSGGGVSRQGENQQRPVRLTPVPRQILRDKHCMETCLRLLSDSGKRPQTAPGLPAWGRTVLQNMGKHSGWT